MADIASELGYSTMTVSKCFKNSSDISSSTCQKVFKTAEKIGYVYQKNTGIKIAVLIKDIFLSKGDTFYNELYQRVHETAGRDHFQLMMIMIDGEDEQGFLKQFFYPELDAILLMGQFSTEFVKTMRGMLTIPIICLDFYTYPLITDAIISNNFMASFEITSHLIALGHQRISFLGTLNTTSSINDRYFGYQKAMLENSLTSFIHVINDREGKVLFNEFSLPEKMPTAFVCNNDHVAFLIIQQLKELGYNVPIDVSVTGFDDVIYSRTSEPTITTMKVSRKYMADSAIAAIMKKIKSKDDIKRLISLDCYMIKRSSISKVNQSLLLKK